MGLHSVIQPPVREWILYPGHGTLRILQEVQFKGNANSNYNEITFYNYYDGIIKTKPNKQ